jgi:type II secretory pathway component GspD/PulD (secretin)
MNFKIISVFLAATVFFWASASAGAESAAESERLALDASDPVVDALPGDIKVPDSLLSDSDAMKAADMLAFDFFASNPVIRAAQSVSEAAVAAQISEELRLKALAEEKAAKDAKEESDIKRRRITSRVFRLNNVSADEVADRINTMWNGDFGVTWKVSKIAQSFTEANCVVITAPAMILDACADIIRNIDVEVPQVYIEARFIELSNNASHKLGIDWQMLDGMKGSLALEAGWNERKMDGVSSYKSSDGSYEIGTLKDANGNIIEPSQKSANLSYVNGTIGMSELSLILRALESTEDARTFSNPKIIVSSGKKATVDMTTKYPNVTISAKRTTSGSSDSLDLSMNMAAIPGEDKFMFAKEAFFSWGIELEVTPRISSNGLINVSIVPTISSLTDWVTAGASDTTDKKDNNAGTYSAKYPVIDVQRLVTEFNMASGSTAVIGGLSLTVETQKDNGIPWLRDIWWIGPKLFGSKVRVKEQREIIVFVTVGIVDPKNIQKDAGLPKNAVLGRQYTNDTRREPGDRKRTLVEGMRSLDLRSLEEQYADPRRTNKVEKTSFDLKNVPVPFMKDPNYKSKNDKTNQGVK